MKSILLVNDDGLLSPGLSALALALSADSVLTIVAPATQKSWIGKASSYHRSLPYRREEVGGLPAIVLDGTPSDCAVAGIHHFCPGKPDFVVSGINVGANVGDSYILSSGTVGGAVEGVLAGIPSLACGLEFSPDVTKRLEFEPSDDDVSLFDFAARQTARAVSTLLGLGLPQPLLFNLNFGQGAGPGSRLVHTTVAHYDYGCFLSKRDGELYHEGSNKDCSRAAPGSDMAVVGSGDISFSILRLFGDDSSFSAVAARFIAAMER
ncbi:MAG TPA: 5'/3'-nucleotidase SurE [Spirochaetia bacterium]|nr:5'/3'-nucleotidase SurE [Spirochaetia bacterium]